MTNESGFYFTADYARNNLSCSTTDLGRDALGCPPRPGTRLLQEAGRRGGSKAAEPVPWLMASTVTMGKLQSTPSCFGRRTRPNAGKCIRRWRPRLDRAGGARFFSIHFRFFRHNGPNLPPARKTIYLLRFEFLTGGGVLLFIILFFLAEF